MRILFIYADRLHYKAKMRARWGLLQGIEINWNNASCDWTISGQGMALVQVIASEEIECNFVSSMISHVLNRCLENQDENILSKSLQTLEKSWEGI